MEENVGYLPFQTFSLLDINLLPHMPILGSSNSAANTDNLMGESNSVVNAYTIYRQLQQYCSHPW